MNNFEVFELHICPSGLGFVNLNLCQSTNLILDFIELWNPTLSNLKFLFLSENVWMPNEISLICAPHKNIANPYICILIQFSLKCISYSPVDNIGSVNGLTVYYLDQWQPSCINAFICFSIKMSSNQYRKSHCGDKRILRPSYLHNGISYTGKTASLYWIRPQVLFSYMIMDK